MAHEIINPTLLRAIRAQYKLDWRGIHGIEHWARVLENGLYLAERTGANIEVVKLFAVFHDACRINDGHDPAHGLRGALLAQHLRGVEFELPDPDFKLLYTACQFHTSGRTLADVTVQTCWDSDRLDLGRVDIYPHEKYLCTDTAKKRKTIEWAYARSISSDVPKPAAAWSLNEPRPPHIRS